MPASGVHIPQVYPSRVPVYQGQYKYPSRITSEIAKRAIRPVISAHEKKKMRFFSIYRLCALDLSVISTGFRRRASCRRIPVSARTHTRWRRTRWCPRRRRRITPPWITITGSLFSVSRCRWRHLNTRQQNRGSIIPVCVCLYVSDTLNIIPFILPPSLRCLLNRISENVTD